MKKGISRELIEESINNNILIISKNHKVVERIAEYVDENYNIPKSETFELFNDTSKLQILDLTELALIGEKIAFEAHENKNWINDYFDGSEIMNMRTYRRLDWKHKPVFTRNKRSSLIYNAGYKNAFVNIYERGNIKRVQSIGFFRAIGKYELKLGKDLCDMELDEIDQLLMNVGYKSYNSAIRDIVIINKYISWSQEFGYAKNMKERNISTSRLNTEKYVYSNLNSHYTLDELSEALNKSNRQFYLISMCIFNGIGAVDFSEIQTLTVDNLIIEDGRYYVSLERGNIEISELLYLQLKDFNGLSMLPNSKFKFVTSDRLFKPFHRSVKKEEVELNKAVRNRIVNHMKEVLEDDSFTIRTIVRSGLDYHIFKCMSDNGEMVLTDSILREISDRFNVHKNKIGYYYGRMLDEINIEFIKDNYGAFKLDEYLSAKI